MFPEPLKEGVIVSRPNRFIMMVQSDSNTIRCHCPTTGRLGDVSLSGLHYLFSDAHSKGRKTAHTVEAIPVEPPGRARSWVGINQTAVNRYVEFFIENGQLPRMASGVLKRELRLGGSRIDFLVGNTYVEVKTPLITLPVAKSIQRVRHGRFDSFDRMIRHMRELRESLSLGRRAVMAMCYLYDAKPFRPPRAGQDQFEDSRSCPSGGGNWGRNLAGEHEGGQERRRGDSLLQERDLRKSCMKDLARKSIRWIFIPNRLRGFLRDRV